MNAHSEVGLSPDKEATLNWKSIAKSMELLKLTKDQMLVLMGMKKSFFYKGMKERKAELTGDQLDRASYLLGIRKALLIIFADSGQAFDWIHRPHSLAPFNGRKPVDLMMSGHLVDLFKVRNYLDTWRGY